MASQAAFSTFKGLVSNVTTTDREAACWRRQDCHSCTHDKHGCGWCPFSSTCVPASSITDPLSHKNTCPLASERWELRTGALGCGCSTTTLLSIIGTVFVTIAAVILVAALIWILKTLNPFFGSGVVAGTELEVKEDGTRVEHEWYRPGLGSKLRAWWQPDSDLSKHSEQEAITERSRLLG
ncbi:hypothetical protein CERZMDRAFT_91539 [Cercospora zeae-maydis SCOH1-5]|uniref:PSI domain-containing protein n=1 Tax=Cercospora zeae-maydis SCOH1-5 TaxID=717836 RepID=A0A6A6F6D4_9PEZI|nr:hypothetical protein CERZMDRAFT_91539 [Cercospora zeae-maydis SCOH1-5]